MIGRIDPRVWSRVRHYGSLLAQSALCLAMLILAYCLVFCLEPMVSEVVR